MRLLFSVLVACAVLTACGSKPGSEPVGVSATSPPLAAATAAHVVERVKLSMGSELHLSAWTTDEPVALAAFDAVFKEFDRLEALMSIWREGSESAVHIIDQQRLPHVFETVRLDSMDAVAQAIRLMRVRGAPLIGVSAAFGVALAMSEDP